MRANHAVIDHHCQGLKACNLDTHKVQAPTSNLEAWAGVYIKMKLVKANKVEFQTKVTAVHHRIPHRVLALCAGHCELNPLTGAFPLQLRYSHY
jgi:hypothetical protein